MRKVYIVRFRFWDGSTEDEIFNNKHEAKVRSLDMNLHGFKNSVKKRVRK